MPAGYFAIREGGGVVSSGGPGDGAVDGEISFTADCIGINYVTARIAADVSYLDNNFVISQVDPLPVTLTSFSLSKEEKNVRLNWNTTSETNSDQFEIQRSRDAKQWMKLGSIKAKGESSANLVYTYLDPQPGSGNNFYRLKMIDRDGTFAYSSIRNISLDGKESVTAYPNPSEGPVQVAIANWKQVKSIAAVDIIGKKVFESGRLKSETITVPHLNKGVNLLKILYDDGSTSVVRVLRP